MIEEVRANAYTLDEHHDHLFSGSFDGPFDPNGFGGIIPSSSNFDGGFVLDNDFLAMGETANVNLEEELDLGEAWGVPSALRSAHRA